MEKFTLEILCDGYKIPLTYLRKKNNILLEASMINGNIEILQICQDFNMFEATMKKLHRTHNYSSDENILSYAGFYGNIETVKWLFKYFELRESFCENAAYNGNLNVLKWKRK
jgi:hypothetical protein